MRETIVDRQRALGVLVMHSSQRNWWWLGLRRAAANVDSDFPAHRGVRLWPTSPTATATWEHRDEPPPTSATELALRRMWG